MAGEQNLDLQFSYQNRRYRSFGEQMWLIVLERFWKLIESEVKIRFLFLEKAAALYLVLDLQVFDVFWNMLGDGQQKTDFWNVNEFNNSSRSDQEPQKK